MVEEEKRLKGSRSGRGEEVTMRGVGEGWGWLEMEGWMYKFIG